MALGLPLEAGLGDADRDCLARPLEAFACCSVCTAWVWPAVTRPAASAGAGDAGPCAVAATTTAPAAATAGATNAARLTTLLCCLGVACRGFASACRPPFLFFACLP